MKIGEKMGTLGNGFIGFAKAMPLVVGGLAGIVIAPTGGYQSVLERALKGEWSDAFKTAACSYIGMNPSGDVHLSEAVGLKGLGVGLLVREAISLLTD
jgi:hypothetical protein